MAKSKKGITVAKKNESRITVSQLLEVLNTSKLSKPSIEELNFTCGSCVHYRHSRLSLESEYRGTGAWQEIIRLHKKTGCPFISVGVEDRGEYRSIRKNDEPCHNYLLDESRIPQGFIQLEGKVRVAELELMKKRVDLSKDITDIDQKIKSLKELKKEKQEHYHNIGKFVTYGDDIPHNIRPILSKRMSDRIVDYESNVEIVEALGYKFLEKRTIPIEITEAMLTRIGLTSNDSEYKRLAGKKVRFTCEVKGHKNQSLALAVETMEHFSNRENNPDYVCFSSTSPMAFSLPPIIDKEAELLAEYED